MTHSIALEQDDKGAFPVATECQLRTRGIMWPLHILRRGPGHPHRACYAVINKTQPGGPVPITCHRVWRGGEEAEEEEESGDFFEESCQCTENVNLHLRPSGGSFQRTTRTRRDISQEERNISPPSWSKL